MLSICGNLQSILLGLCCEITLSMDRYAQSPLLRGTTNIKAFLNQPEDFALRKNCLYTAGASKALHGRGHVCKNYSPIPHSWEGARPAIVRGSERKSTTIGFFSPTLQLFFLHDLFFKAKGQHSCSSLSLTMAPFKCPLWHNSFSSPFVI